MADQVIPQLMEHQPIEDSSSGPGEYQPTPEERKKIKLVRHLFEKSKKWRENYDNKWLHYYKMFRGKQWDKGRPSYRHSEVINMIFQSIQSAIPILTDSRPKIEFLPMDPSDFELSSILNDVLTSDWDRNSWDEVLVENILEAHLYGVGMSSMEYDPKANYGAGGIKWESEDPFYCYPDPNSHDVNKKSRHWIKAEPVDVNVLKVEYPKQAQWIKADLEDFVKTAKTQMDETSYKSPVDSRTLIETDERPDGGMSDKALKITCWLKSDEIIEEKKSKGVNPDTGVEEFLYEQKLKYPNGEKICIAGGVLLDDVDNYDDGLFPFARLVNYHLPREFYAISEVEQLESPQKIFNKLVSFALDVLTMMGNPIWKVGTGSGVDTDALFNRPGLVVEADDINQVQREEGVALQPYVLQLIDRMRDWFDGVSGNQEVSQGIKPEGVSAASAIVSLQQAAQTRLRLKGRNIDTYLKQMGNLYLHRAFQFYTAPRMTRVSNNPNAQKYFKFHVTERPQMDPATGLPNGKTDRVAVVTPYGQDPNTGQAVEQPPKEYIIRGDFDVKVSTGSGLPFAKDQKMNVATQLFDRQAIDRIELLKAADYPNAEAINARMDQQAQQAAMAQQMSAAPPGGAPPPAAPPPAA